MKGLKITLAVTIIISMIILTLGVFPTARQAPPYPEKVISNGETVMDREAIIRGQQVFQKYGLMDVGSIWGHGSMRGPDFSALTLHMLGEHMREHLAKEAFNKSYPELEIDQKSVIDAKAIRQLKENGYDGDRDELKITPAQAYAFGKIKEYYQKFFTEGSKGHTISANTIKTQEEIADISSFFFWLAWAAGTNRPGKDYTYTNNWPPDQSVGNTLPPLAIQSSIIALTLMLIGLGIVIYIIHRRGFFGGVRADSKAFSSLINARLTPSQGKVAKYFLVVSLLFLVQTLLGGLLAHYTVHPRSFYGLEFIPQWFPYNQVKTWHQQLLIFWIAVAWVGAAIYLAPIIGGKDPKLQGFLVDVLCVATILVAVGSLLGEAFGIRDLLGSLWYWLGYQGWEWIQLGRLWQILLTVGLVLWLFIVFRAVKGRFGGGQGLADLTHLFVYAAISIVLVYAVGFLVTSKGHIVVSDYFRWFVVHLWVENTFDFFSVVAIGLITVSTGLTSKNETLRIILLSAILYFGTGIIGTAHHYYWFGDASFWLPLGGTFSTLEMIPLVTLVARAWREMIILGRAGVDFPYKWPVYFLIASGIWNFLGTGVFGTVITLPVTNYYEHGTYLTVNHAHTALFGTFGMLALGLLLCSWRGLVKPEAWSDGPVKLSFFGLNIGFLLLSFGSMFPVGVYQFIASYTKGVWYAKSPEFYNSPFVQFFGQIRMIPDLIIILLGVLPIVIFLLRTVTQLKGVTLKEGEAIFRPGEVAPVL